MNDEVLHRLAQRAGLAATWRDYRGVACEVPPETLRRILDALGYPCASPQQEFDSLARIEDQTSSAHLPPLVTAVAGEPVSLGQGLPAEQECELLLEDGSRRLLRCAGDGGAICLPPIDVPGYHRLRTARAEITLAVAPPRGFGLDDIAPGQRCWGLSAQLYSLRRVGDGGFGDFRALAELVQQAAEQGADAVALSPVHALFSADAQHYGPYAPSSRLFLNVGYADVDSFGELAPPLTDDARRLEGLELIDWPEATRARLLRLRALYERLAPRLDRDDDALCAEFADFCSSGGAALLDHARFEALHAQQFAAGRWHWQYWPEALRQPQNPEVEEFARQHAEEVRFHLFLQWLARRGLAAAQATAQRSGMAIGLIGDLAVGTDSGGSHAWSRQRELLRGLSVGAPPDELAGLGQNWGLTAFSPRALREEGYAPFLEVLRANLRDVGGLRIDHAFGLQRLWIVPEGASPSDGAYLYYPLQDLLRLVALESWRARAVIVGEDLGTVPEGFREAIDRVGMLGMRVLWFEREYGYFVEPARWPAHAMATTTTHDLPTTAGWWAGRDIDWRVRLRHLPAETDEEQLRAQRGADRQALWDAFVYADVAAGEPPADAAPVVDAALRFIGRTPCALAMVPIEDVVGLEEQPNLPGTLDEHPNWRRRLPAPTAELFADAAAQRRLAALRAARGNGGGSG